MVLGSSYQLLLVAARTLASRGSLSPCSPTLRTLVISFLLLGPLPGASAPALRATYGRLSRSTRFAPLESWFLVFAIERWSAWWKRW